MTEQELKARIRKRIHRDLGDIPDWVWEHYWNLSVVCEYLEGDTGSEPDIMGEDGDIYVNQMKTVLETLNTVTPHDVPSFSLSRNRQQPTPREQTLRPMDAYGLAENVEAWWSVLPERDRQAVQMVWDFAYNLLEVSARRFREKYTNGRTLTLAEAVEWVTAPENGFGGWSASLRCIPECVYLTDARKGDTFDGFPLWDLTLRSRNQAERRVVVCRPDSLLDRVCNQADRFRETWGMTVSVVISFLLMGERVDARLPATPATSLRFTGISKHITYIPNMPPYLSAKAVERLWQLIRFPCSVKAWTLMQCDLAPFKSYQDALNAWNALVPDETWRIPDYRTFRREWKRAMEKAKYLPNHLANVRPLLEARWRQVSPRKTHKHRHLPADVKLALSFLPVDRLRK
jgi:hypothetical protein